MSLKDFFNGKRNFGWSKRPARPGELEQAQATIKKIKDKKAAGKSDRIDCKEDGRLDDIVLEHVKMFRMELMNNGSFWIRCYRDKEHGEDVVFWLDAIIDENGEPELKGKWHYDGNGIKEDQ